MYVSYIIIIPATVLTCYTSNAKFLQENERRGSQMEKKYRLLRNLLIWSVRINFGLTYRVPLSLVFSEVGV